MHVAKVSQEKKITLFLIEVEILLKLERNELRMVLQLEKLI